MFSTFRSKPCHPQEKCKIFYFVSDFEDYDCKIFYFVFKEAGLLQSKGLIGGKWVGADDGKTLPVSLYKIWNLSTYPNFIVLFAIIRSFSSPLPLLVASRYDCHNL